MAHLSHFYLKKYPINYILVIVGENMKKALIFLLTFFIGFALINADEVSDVACLYDLGTYGKVEIQINNYNTNNPSVSIKCQDKDTYQYKNYNSKKVYNNCKGESTTMPYDFFSYSKDEHSFISKYKKNYSCPQLYANPYEKSDGDDKYVYFETIELKTNIDFDKVKNLYQHDFKNATEGTLVKEAKKLEGSDKFVDASEVNKSLPKKDDKPCKYDMNFDKTKRVTPWYVNFVTTYDENSNYKETYKIKIAGRSDIIVDLDKDIKFALGAYQDQTVEVTSEQLKAIFLYDKEDCKPGEEIFHYTYNRDTNQINITTNEQEAYDNSVDHKYDNGAGSKGGTGATGRLGATGDGPSLTGFGEGGDSCSAVLGTTFSALVKEVIKWVRIAGGIIAIVNGMLKLIPAIMSKDAEALSKAAKTCVIMAIILVFCALFPWLLNLIGSIFKWDVSCIV